MPAGRPSKYTEDTPNKVRQYLETYGELDKPCKQLIPTVAGLSLYLHVARETIWAWTQDEDKEEFSNVIRELMAEQEMIIASNGLSGEFTGTISKLLLVKHGHSDKIETKTSGSISVTVSEQDLEL